MSYSSSKIEKFSKSSRFLYFFPVVRGFKINYFGICSAYFKFFVICTLHHLRIHKDQLSNNKKKQVIRLEKWDFISNGPLDPAKKNLFFEKEKTNKIRITSKHLLGLCGLVSVSSSV